MAAKINPPIAIQRNRPVDEGAHFPRRSSAGCHLSALRSRVVLKPAVGNYPEMGFGEIAPSVFCA